jgi:hypothetical protein
VPVAGKNAHYDAVLEAYSAWLLAQRTNGWLVADLHGPMAAALREGRTSRPSFTFARDGVHPDAAGHRVMARALIRYVEPAADPDRILDDPRNREVLALVRERMTLRRDAWLTATKHQRPGVPAGLPLPEAEAKAAELTKKMREKP